MADANKVLEGSLKYRDGKKWKQRWCVLQRLSPVADCLHMFLYKEHSDCIKVPSKSTIVLEDYYGLDEGLVFDKESHVLSIVCRNRVINLAFHNQETLDIWRLTIIQRLGEGKSFDAVLVRVPPSLKVVPGPVSVYVHRSSICLVSPRSNGSLPRFLASWRIGELRRFGILGDRFCFELEEKNAGGAFLLETSLLNELNHVISNIAHGRNADNPSLPPKPCRTGTEPAVVKPHLESPVCKASSLDRNSLCKSESGKFETDCNSSEHSGSSLRRRQLSEPREFSRTAETSVTKDDRAGCYHNIWCCNEAPEKISVEGNQRLLCEKLITGCLEISEKVTNNIAKTSSLSKICCLPGAGCCEAGQNCSGGCRPSVFTYINIQSNEPKHLRHCASVCERRPSSARTAVRCASSDVLRCGVREETELLQSNESSDYVNDGVRTADNFTLQPKGALVRRASDDTPSARDPLKPLPYVDLRRFDGDAREGYLYNLKASWSARRQFPSAGVRQSLPGPAPARPSSYANLPMPKSVGEYDGARTASAQAPKPAVTTPGRLSFHASLKRPNKAYIPAKNFLSLVPPVGSYADLHPPGPPPSMLRSSSYYNVQLNTAVASPLHKANVGDELPVTSRRLPSKPSGQSFVGGNRAVGAECLDVSVPCKISCRNSENKPTPEVEYVLMNGHSDADDTAIFFPVSLPMRRENLQQTEAKQPVSRSAYAETGATGLSCIMAPPVVRNSEAAGYVDMSGINATDSSGTGLNIVVRLSDYRPKPRSGERPKLRHSRSLEDELDSPPKAGDQWSALSQRTSHGAIHGKKKRHCSPEDWKDSPGSDYLPMDFVSARETTEETGQSPAFPNPFDDLISHTRYKLPTSPRERNQFFDARTEQADDKSTYSRRSVDSVASDPAINFWSERSNSLKSGKSFRLLSRFLRRHSSAKEKAASANSLGNTSSNVTVCSPHEQSANAAVDDDGHREQLPCTQLHVSVSKSSSPKADGISISSCSSSLEKLGPPPPVPSCQPRDAAPENPRSEHHVNLSSASLRTVLPLSDGSSDYLNVTPLPPPLLPPKSTLMQKNPETDPLQRSVAVEKILVMEKQPLRSITEDEQEVPPLPEKLRARSACQSKGLSADVSVSSAVVEANPKPPVPPRSIPSTTASPSVCTISNQRSPRVPISPIERHLSAVEFRSRKPNLTVDIAPSFERRDSKDDVGIVVAAKVPVQLRHLSDLRQSERVRIVSEMSSVSVSSGEESRPSPALTTMRPRYGKEYQCVDRRRLYEEDSPFSPQRSPSLASSVFIFDNTTSNLRGVVSGNCSSGENSPKYPPSHRSRIASDHVSSSRNVSPIVLDPMVDSPPAVDARTLLNYAEIDLSATELAQFASAQRATSRTDNDKTEYALIDLVATSAASRVGREHARQREDKERMAASIELREGKLGLSGRSLAIIERKGSADAKRTPGKDLRFGLFS